MIGADPIVVALLERILEGQAEILAELRAGRGASPADLRNSATADLLRAIVAAVGDRVFNSAELAAHAALPDAADLEAAIVAAVGSLRPRRIGKALRALDARDVGGLMVSRVGEDRGGAIWAVRECGPGHPQTHIAPCVALPPRGKCPKKTRME